LPLGLEHEIFATKAVCGRVFISYVVNTAQVLNLDLVSRAQAGDDGAFTALLRPAIAPAYRLAGAMLHDSHAAEDVVQDASLKAWRKLDQLKAGREMQPWFLGIVANECRSARRTRWWSVLRLSDPEPPAVPAGDSLAVFADLRSAIRRLKHRRRLLLVLHWYLDLPVAEVAAITGSSEDAVKSELSRAVRELRRLLGAGEA
jgi:RNA polymerase sigma-70 factor (ECF subfamily)